jgi:hypothetical protein
VPPLLPQPIGVGLGPVLGQPFFREEFGEHDVTVLNDTDLDRRACGIQHTPDVGRPATQTPQHTSAGLGSKGRHEAECPFDCTPTGTWGYPVLTG